MQYFIFVCFYFFNTQTHTHRSKLNKVLSKRQQVHELLQLETQNLYDYINDYITNKLVVLWSHGWMKTSDIRSQFLKSGKAKIKDPKRSIGDISTDRVPTTKEHEPNKKAQANINNSDKSKAHGSKDLSTKSSKPSSERPTVAKTERKHDKPDDSIDNLKISSDIHVSTPKSTACITSTVGFSKLFD